MTQVRRLVLDVLKPHHPNVLDFTRLLAEQGGLRVKLTVVEMDDQTETLQVVIEGADIDFERLQGAIADSGASLHSIDEVEVEGGPEATR
ncbi:MAG: DUF211 domain-containing protein [Myxococcota bacterium]|nr:DUF211 domain-containing protein [Myxococcota bacterium]